MTKHPEPTKAPRFKSVTLCPSADGLHFIVISVTGTLDISLRSRWSRAEVQNFIDTGTIVTIKDTP